MPSFTFEIRYRDIDGEEKVRTEHVEDAIDLEQAEIYARIRVGASVQERDPTSIAEAATVGIISITDKEDE